MDHPRRRSIFGDERGRGKIERFLRLERSEEEEEEKEEEEEEKKK